MPVFQLIHYAGPEALARAAARDWLDDISGAAKPGGIYTVALSGGRIARQFFEAVTGMAGPAGNLLAAVQFFWADERCVSPLDPESNYRLAHDLMLGPLGIPASRVHRLQGEMEPAQAARQAAAELRSVAWAGAAGLPVLDMVLLGMGEDGHVASLFPEEAAALRADPAIYRPVRAAKPPPYRITLGYGVIAAAREVWVLASGAGKAAALQRSLSLSGDTPLARLLKLRRCTKIYSDIEDVKRP